MIDQHTQDRFWSQVVKSRKGGCWLWDGPMSDNGHGYFMYQRQAIGAYRMAYMIVNGEVPNGLIICHRCNEGQCVKPKHLYAGTAAENANDRKETGRRWMVYPQMPLRDYHKNLMSPRTVQKLLGIGAVELRMLNASGTLIVYRTPRNTWGYKRSEIEDFLKTHMGR